MAAIIFLSIFLLILRLRIGATGYSPGYTATGPVYSIERVTIFISEFCFLQNTDLMSDSCHLEHRTTNLVLNVCFVFSADMKIRFESSTNH